MANGIVSLRRLPEVAYVVKSKRDGRIYSVPQQRNQRVVNVVLAFKELKAAQVLKGWLEDHHELTGEYPRPGKGPLRAAVQSDRGDVLGNTIVFFRRQLGVSPLAPEALEVEARCCREMLRNGLGIWIGREEVLHARRVLVLSQMGRFAWPTNSAKSYIQLWESFLERQ